ncbi:FHA domain-containing protein [Microbacterium sp. JZ70]
MASARCAYCAATLEPSSMYCLACGQLVLTTRADRAADDGWEPTERAAAPAPVPPAEPAADSRAATAPSAPAWTPPDIAPPATRAAARAREAWGERVRLVFSTGEDVIVSGSAVIGRRPEQTAATLGAQAVEVADTTRSMSRVHLYLELERGVLRAGDAGSGNGSSLRRGDRTIPLPVGEQRVEVRPGDALRVGDVDIALSPA